jgi:hypothetical protein
MLRILTTCRTLRSCAWPRAVDRLEAIGPDTLGTADVPKSPTMWNELPPGVVGAPFLRDRDKPPMGVCNVLRAEYPGRVPY